MVSNLVQENDVNWKSSHCLDLFFQKLVVSTFPEYWQITRCQSLFDVMMFTGISDAKLSLLHSSNICHSKADLDQVPFKSGGNQVWNVCPLFVPCVVWHSFWDEWMFFYKKKKRVQVGIFQICQKPTKLRAFKNQITWYPRLIRAGFYHTNIKHCKSTAKPWFISKLMQQPVAVSIVHFRKSLITQWV